MTGAPHSSVKRYRELARTPQKTGLQRELLLDGVHLVSEAHATGLPIVSAAFAHDGLTDPEMRDLAERLAAGGVEVLIVSRKSLEAMSPVKSPSGVVAIVRHGLVTIEDAIKSAVGAPLIVVAHDVQDPGNMGALVRTAEATGATAVIATGGSADPLGWKALRGSMGSALRLPVVRDGLPRVLETCRAPGTTVAALVPRGGRPFFLLDFRGPTVVLLGGEGGGLPDATVQQADVPVSIPMTSPVESLNVGVAAALVLYEAFRQRTQ